MLRVGLIGCGGMGSVHATVWSEMSDKAELVAIADLNQNKWQKFADKLGAKFYKDAYEMIEKEEPRTAFGCDRSYAPYPPRA